MDFETLGLALPRFAGTRPYDQLPFQWSLHIQRKPGGAVEHYEFLADNEDDPRPLFLKSLCQAIDRKGSIVVYSNFESGPSGLKWVYAPPPHPHGLLESSR